MLASNWALVRLLVTLSRPISHLLQSKRVSLRRMMERPFDERASFRGFRHARFTDFPRLHRSLLLLRPRGRAAPRRVAEAPGLPEAARGHPRLARPEDYRGDRVEGAD